MKNIQIKKKLIIVVICIFIIVIALLSFKNFNDNKINTVIIINNQDNKNTLKDINKLLENIKNNMDYISTSNLEDDSSNWTYYKLNLDEKSKLVYDKVIQDVRNCYVYFTDDRSIYSDTNFLAKFNGLDKISKKEFNKIVKSYSLYDNGCFSDYGIYNDLLLHDDINIETLKSIIQPMVLYKKINNVEFNDYSELLKNEYYKVSLLNSITEYLKLKYDKEK